jgi:hypothetical protein
MHGKHRITRSIANSTASGGITPVNDTDPAPVVRRYETGVLCSRVQRHRHATKSRFCKRRGMPLEREDGTIQSDLWAYSKHTSAM